MKNSKRKEMIIVHTTMGEDFMNYHEHRVFVPEDKRSLKPNLSAAMRAYFAEDDGTDEIETATKGELK